MKRLSFSLLLASMACIGQVKVLYTGKTFGYLRIPDAQPLDMIKCGQKADAQGPTAEFLKALDEVREADKTGEFLTLGMGDNFGPNLYGRTMSIPYTAGSMNAPHPPKDFYLWPPGSPTWVKDNGQLNSVFKLHQGKIPADNVGCFLRIAGYDVVVPGKHDFEAGPERLIQMANFLRSPVKDLPETWMLGANLTISTATPDAKPRLPTYQLEQELKRNGYLTHDRITYKILFPPMSHNKPSPAPKLPDVVFPWAMEVDIVNAFELNTTLAGGKEVVYPMADLEGKWKLSTSSDVDHPASPKISEANGQDLFLTKKGKPALKLKVSLRIGLVHLCLGLRIPGDPYSFLYEREMNCVQLDEKAGPQDKGSSAHESGTITYELPQLTQDTNYGICIEMLEDGMRYCKPLSVAKPFFQNADGGQVPYLPPYRLIDRRGKKVAVFGVVDPDIQNRIGRLNYGWYNDNKQYETTVRVSDPGKALQQAVTYFCKTYEAIDEKKKDETKKDCRDVRKVLLAQMPAFKARQMLGSLNSAVFDLVVAQTDPSNKTGNYSATKISPTDSSANFVVTPDELFVDGQIHSSIQLASVDRLPLPAPAGSQKSDSDKWSLENTLPKKDIAATVTIPQGGAGMTLRQAAEQTMHDLLTKQVDRDEVSVWSNADLFQRLALLLMQRKLHTDIAMIQARDLYDPNVHGSLNVDNETLQELLDRIYWKNDFTFPIPMTGATLTSILTQSQTFATQDADPLNTDLEKGRSLVTLGVFKEAAEQNWSVNTDIVDPARQYSAAFTDFLALGDTGYTALQTPSVPMPFRIKDYTKLHSISSLVCDEIRQRVNNLRDAPCGELHLQASEYTDPSAERPPDVTPGFTMWQQSKAYVNGLLRVQRYDLLWKGQSPAEVLSSGKPFWSVSVEKNDFNLNFNRHMVLAGKQTAGLTQLFNGVQVPAATAPNSYSLGFDNRMRLKYSRNAMDWFVLDDIAFSYSRIQSNTDNYTRSLSANALSFETGLTTHLWPPLKRRSVSQYDFLTSFRVDGQVLGPRNDISVPQQTCIGDPSDPTKAQCPAAVNVCTPQQDPVKDNCVALANPGGTIRGSLRRAVDTYVKIGLRKSDTRSWIEAGFMTGASFNVPFQELVVDPAGTQTIALNSGIANATACGAGKAASTCTPPSSTVGAQDFINYLSFWGKISPNDPIKPQYKTKDLSGLFLNFSLNVPLPVADHYTNLAGNKPFAFLAENTGRLLFNRSGDINTQTRYYDKLALSVIIPVLGNFTLKPEVDLVYYRNKVANIPFHSFNYLATFSYTFDWRQPAIPSSNALRQSGPNLSGGP